MAVGPSEKEGSFCPKIMFTVWVTQNTPKLRATIFGYLFF